MLKHLFAATAIEAFWLLSLFVLTVMFSGQIRAQDAQANHQHHKMTFDSTGMVMNSNHHNLPADCREIGADYNFTVYAGTKFAKDYPGTIFGMSQHEYLVEACSRITVTFINEDEIRHQWMVHGLPRYLYPGGMFHIEAAGGHTQTGTFIVPGDDRTYLVHCDMAQHMEKGMKGQIKVGKGSGDLWAVPGVSQAFIEDSYLPENAGLYVMFVAIMAILLTILIISRRRF